MFGKRIKIDNDLYTKASKCAELAGYSSPDEFIQHALEKEISKIMSADSDDDTTPEEIKKRLQGLGYIE